MSSFTYKLITTLIMVALFIVPTLAIAYQEQPGKLIPKQIGKRWGYVNSSGDMVIAPKFDRASNFSEGIAAIAIIDHSGDVGEGENVFSLAPAKWGFINEKGEIITDPQYFGAGNFSEGLARVRVGNGLTGQWGYINSQGTMVIAPQFGYALDFKNGYAEVGKGNVKTGGKGSVVTLTFHGKKGFIDKAGKFTKRPKL